MQTSNNPFSASLQVLYKPNGVFSVLKEKQNWSWIPFLLVVVSSVLPIYLYYSTIDFSWFIETATVNSPPEVKAMMETYTQKQFRATAIAASFISAIIGCTVVAIYLNLATKFDPDNINGFTDWYGFAWWASMPLVISNLIGTFLIIVMASPQVNANVLYPLSLAFVLNVGLDSKWLSLLQSVGLSSVWSIYLMAVGLSRWINVSASKAFAIASLPFAIIWMIWIAFLI